MSIRQQMTRLAWLVAATSGLGGLSTACSKEEPSPASPASVAQPQSFQFAPPDGTEYVRTDRRREEIAIVGVPLRKVDEDELTWNIGIEHRGDQYRVKQELVMVDFERDGRTVAKGKPPKGIAAELVIDRDGNLMDVSGLDQAAEVLRSLAGPGEEAEAERVITPDLLAYVIAMRYRLLFGETIGRGATPGTSWTISNPPGSVIMSRTVTVTGQETCDATTCARLKVDFKLDPRQVADAAADIVKSRVSESGGDPSKVTVRDASYEMKGSMLVEPATMLSHGAMLNEGGKVTVVDPDQKSVTVEIKGTTELSYSYGAGPAAMRSGERTKSSLAAE